MDRRNENLGKVLILGNSQVGKSSILNQFAEGVFSETITPTLGIDYKINQVAVGDKSIKLQIWDTAGQERFKSITENFYKGAQGILLVFDLTDASSFANITTWLKNIYEKAGKNVVVCLVGNKLDLAKKFAEDPTKRDQLVREEDVNELIKQTGFHYLQTSAKENINIKEAFQYIAQELMKRLEGKSKPSSSGTGLGGSGSTPKKSCCGGSN